MDFHSPLLHGPGNLGELLHGPHLLDDIELHETGVAFLLRQLVELSLVKCSQTVDLSILPESEEFVSVSRPSPRAARVDTRTYLNQGPSGWEWCRMSLCDEAEDGDGGGEDDAVMLPHP